MSSTNPNICFSDDYHFDALCAISGSIEILGLSPWNDFHIFEAIDNSAVDECIFYYHDVKECSVIEKLLPTLSEKGNLKFLSVIEFWERCNEN